MTRQEAHRLLDAARGGYPTSAQLIDEALQLTGDLGGQAPIQIWRSAEEWGETDYGRLGPAGPFDGLFA